MNNIGFGEYVKEHIMLLPFTNLSTMPRPTKRAPDLWDSARFTGIFLASGFFYISNIVHARPQAGNANRWALARKNIYIEQKIM